MKILVIAPTPFFSDRGTHIRILEEALALEKLGHEITIATYHIGKNIPPELKSAIDVRRIRRLLFWYKKLEAGPDWQKIILDSMLIRKAFYLARTKKPDIIHGHLHEGALIGWIVRKMLFWRRMKLVVDLHGSLTREMVSHSYLRNGILKKIFRALEKWINNRGDFAVTSSWENSREMSGMRRDKNIETVLDGVNLNSYAALPAREECRKKFGIPPDKSVILYTGALMPNKGIEYLLQAIPLALLSCSHAHFVLAGFPVEWLREYVRAHRLGRNVTLVYPLNYFDLPSLLRAGDISVDPKDSSTRQASGKILQYMAAGLPVVCFDRMNNREYLGEGAYYSAEISPEGIARGIIYFLSNPEEAKRRGETNRARAKEFSWEKAGRRIEEVYGRIIGERVNDGL